MMSDVNVNTTTPPPPGVNSLALLATKANNQHIRQFVDVDAVAGAFALVAYQSRAELQAKSKGKQR